MSSFLLKKKAYAGSFAFLFQFEEIGCRIECLWRPMATILYRKRAEIRRFRRFNDDNFDLNDKKHENRPRKVKDCPLQALLDEDDIQSQKMLAEQLGVSQAIISMWLYARMGKGKDRKMGAA